MVTAGVSASAIDTSDYATNLAPVKHGILKI